MYAAYLKESDLWFINQSLKNATKTKYCNVLEVSPKELIGFIMLTNTANMFLINNI